MPVGEVPEVVRKKALAVGAAGWLAELPALVANLEREWSLRVGRVYGGGTEAFLRDATLEDGTELLHGHAHERAAWLAARTGLDATAIWEWGAVERVSTGLLCTRIGLQPVGREMLAVAERVSAG